MMDWWYYKYEWVEKHINEKLYKAHTWHSIIDVFKKLKSEYHCYTGETTSELASSAKLRVQKFFDDNLKSCE